MSLTSLGGELGSPSVTQEQARLLVISLFPPGQLYDWHNPDADIYKFIDAAAETFRTFGFNLVDIARAEFNTLTAVDKLVDWEGALGLETVNGKSTTDRQAAVVGKLRESGAVTPANVRSAIAPLTGLSGAQLQVIETSRAALTALHTYGEAPGVTIPDSPASVIRTVYVSDDGVVSASGAQLIVTITHPAVESLSVALTAPDGTTVATWSGLGTGSVTGRAYYLNAPAMAGVAITGNWSLRVSDTVVGGATGTLVSWSLFVEGFGVAGLSGAIFEWGVYVDPTLAPNADWKGILAALGRMQPVHSKAYLIRSTACIPDDPNSIPDQCLPG